MSFPKWLPWIWSVTNEVNGGTRGPTHGSGGVGLKPGQARRRRLPPAPVGRPQSRTSKAGSGSSSERNAAAAPETLPVRPRVRSVGAAEAELTFTSRTERG
ncbi:unnamed protein product [Arctogadus glacialis]